MWIDFAAGVYGIPDLDAHGFKVGIDRHGPPIDPDTEPIEWSTRRSSEIHADWLARRFPAVARRPAR